MRILFAILASGAASVAAVIASLAGDADFVPFYVGLAFCSACAAASAHEPVSAMRRRLVQAAAWLWAIAAVWVGLLLVMANTQASSPPSTPEPLFVGIPPAAFYMIALYGGTVLMVLAAQLPSDRATARTSGVAVEG